MQLAEESRSAGAEVDHGSTRGANALDQRARIGLDIAHIVARSQRAHPAIENLDGTRAGADLQAGEITEHIDELAHEPPPHRFIGEHQFLGLEKGAGGTTFDHVAGERKGSANEANYR